MTNVIQIYIRLRLHHYRTVFYRYFIQIYVRLRLQNKDESDRIKIPKNTKISCVHFIFILPYGWYYENFQGHPLECWHVSCYVFMQWHVNKTHTLQTIAMKNMSLLILSCVVQIRFSLTQMSYKPYIVLNSDRFSWLLRLLTNTRTKLISDKLANSIYLSWVNINMYTHLTYFPSFDKKRKEKQLHIFHLFISAQR